jgi:hypothetical protein
LTSGARRADSPETVGFVSPPVGLGEKATVVVKAEHWTPGI